MAIHFEIDLDQIPKSEPNQPILNSNWHHMWLDMVENKLKAKIDKENETTMRRTLFHLLQEAKEVMLLRFISFYDNRHKNLDNILPHKRDEKGFILSK